MQSQYYPESRLSSDLISYRERSSRASIYQQRGTSTHHERISAHSTPLVPHNSFIDKEPPEPPTDQDSNLAYFEFDIHLPHLTNKLFSPPLLQLEEVDGAWIRMDRSNTKAGRRRIGRRHRQLRLFHGADISTTPWGEVNPGIYGTGRACTKFGVEWIDCTLIFSDYR